MSIWKKYRLGDFIDITSSKRIFFSDYVDFGIPFYRSKEIIEKALGQNVSTELFISEEKYNEIKNNFGAPIDGDLLISAVGERAGIPYFVKNDGDFYFKDGNLIWFKKFLSEIDSRYLCYFFKSSVGQQQLEASMIGSAQKALTIIGLKNLEIKFPSEVEQISIAGFLSSIDDKIDLLQRQNKTLEQLAETLFRQWFFEEAAESWEETTVGKVLKTELGGTPSTKRPDYWDGNIPWINSGEVNNFRIDKASKYITRLGLKESNTKLMPKGTIVIAITGATLGQISILEIEACANQSVVGIIPNKDFPMEFVFLWVKLKLKEIISNQTGGAQQHINKNDVNETQIIIPPKSLMGECMPILSSLFNKISSNIKQISTLTQLRDTLLPKLMSGEVRVKMD